MPAREKILITFIVFLAVFLVPSKNVLAEVFINEFSSYGDSDWVEIYRTKEENLSLYKLEDAAGNTKELSLSDCNGDFCVVNWSNKLNNSGDVIKLILLPITVVDQITYGNEEGALIEAPQAGQSAGRVSDGENIWAIFSTPTKGSTNNAGVLLPTLTPTPTQVFTPTLTPTPIPILKATYKINEVKDKNGNVLSSVKIYVDGVYIHHYAPETLTFCDGCKCDTYVDCGFGSHIIELQRTGYQDWSEEINIKAGDGLEVSPVMEKEENNLPTSTSTSTPTLILTSKLTPTPTPKIIPTEATKSGEVLGEEEEATAGGFYPLEATEEGEKIEEETPEGKKNSKNKILGGIFIGVGLVALFGAAFSLWYTKLK